jgi:hypothetical protein
MLIINTQSHLNYITNKLYLMSCCQWLGFRERHGCSSFMGIAWSIRLTGNNLVFNDIKRNMKSCFSLTLHWLSAWLQNYCEEHFNRSLHSPSWLILIFSFIVVEDIYRRRQPFLSMDAIYIYFIQPTKEKLYIFLCMHILTRFFSAVKPMYGRPVTPDFFF